MKIISKQVYLTIQEVTEELISIGYRNTDNGWVTKWALELEAGKHPLAHITVRRDPKSGELFIRQQDIETMIHSDPHGQ